MSTEVMVDYHRQRVNGRSEPGTLDGVPLAAGILALFLAVLLVFVVGGLIASTLGGVVACSGISFISKARQHDGG